MADEETEEGGGGKKLIIIVFLVLLLLFGGGAAAYFLLLSPDKENSGTNSQTSQEEIDKEISSASQKEASKLSDPHYTPAKKYVVNLRDGRHFLTIKMVAALEDPEALSFLATREPIIDDMIISLLGNLTSEDLRTPEGKALLKREIYKKVNSVFTQEFVDESSSHDATPVKKILFTEFILN